MAENRGNPSGTNNALLSRPNGVTRNKSSDVFSQRDMQTFKDMSIANLKVVEMIYDITKSKSLKGFGKTIDELSDSLIKAQQTVNKEVKEIDETMLNYKKQMAKEIQLEEKKKGNQINIAQAYNMLMQTKEAQEFQKTHDRRIEELQKNTKKEYLKSKFKIETKSNELSYLDSKFARGNNLAKVNNEYYGELEKLKSTALDAFGEGFENREDFKKALMNLNATYIQEARSARKEDFKENHRIISSISDGFKDTFERNKTALQGVLGPLNLFIAPIQDFFGGFGMIFKGIKGGFNFLLNKFTKKTPTASDVIKSGPFGVGALYLGGILTKLLGDLDLNKKEGIFEKIKNVGRLIPNLIGMIKKIPILGSAIKGAKLVGKSFGKNVLRGSGKLLGKGGRIAKFIKSPVANAGAKAMGPMAIIAGLAEMTIDGIRGMFNAKKWKVSKGAGFLGGFLGGVKKGIVGMFANMGKWATLGAGIGAMAGGVAGGVGAIPGALIGGLIGSAIGGILGFIGGEKLAKAFDGMKAFGAKALEWIKKTAVGVWNLLWNGLIKKPISLITNLLKKAFNGTKSFGVKIIGWIKNAFNIDKFKSIFQSDGSLGKKIIESLKTLVVTALTFIPKVLFGNTLMKNILKNKKITDALGKLGEGIGKTFNGIKNLFSSKMEAMKEKWSGIKEFGGEVWEGIQNSELGQFVSKLFDSLENGITQFFRENPIGVWVESHIIQPIKNAFIQIGAWFGYIGDAFEKDGIKGALGAMTVGMFKKDKETGLTEFEQYKQNLLNPTDVTTVNDAIIRTDGSIIKTNPSDTLVALKDVPKSFDKVREDTSKVLNYNLENVRSDNVGVENKLSNIIDILSKILAKDLQVQMPPQTRGDLDLLISGALI